MPASPIQARSSLSEDEKKYSDADVAPVDAPPSEHAREGGVNLKRLIRRVDYRLLPALGLLYLFSYLDRTALANASIFGYKEDLGIDQTGYNLISTIFFVPYGLFEVPSQICLMYIAPHTWISVMGLAWGITMTMNGLVKNFGGAMAGRFILGVTEAGFFPAALAICGDWYHPLSLQSRMGIFYGMGQLSGAFGGLFAYAISYMEGVGGFRSWRWIFLLEGIATVILAVGLYFVLPNRVDQCKWLNQEEKDAIWANRARGTEDDPLARKFEWRYLTECLTDYKVLIPTWLAMCSNIVGFGFAYQFPTILTQMGYRAANAQLLTVPVHIIGCLLVFATGWYSDRIGKRYPSLLFGQGMVLLGLIFVFAFPIDPKYIGPRYLGCIFISAGGKLCYPGNLAWVSNNAENNGKRHIALAVTCTMGSLSTVVGTNVYLGREAPRYTTGLSLSIGLITSGLIATLTLRHLLIRANRKLDEQEGGRAEGAFRYIL